MFPENKIKAASFAFLEEEIMPARSDEWIHHLK
jgi:hypothetical protein